MCWCQMYWTQIHHCTFQKTVLSVSGTLMKMKILPNFFALLVDVIQECWYIWLKLLTGRCCRSAKRSAKLCHWLSEYLLWFKSFLWSSLDAGDLYCGSFQENNLLASYSFREDSLYNPCCHHAACLAFTLPVRMTEVGQFDDADEWGQN